MNKPTISSIAALGRNTRAIGKNNQLLWEIPEDLAHFRKLTLGHTVIMGRKTWESIPEKFRPLPGRKNIVVTRNKKYVAPKATLASSVKEAVGIAEKIEPSEVFIMGGGEIYKSSMPYVTKLYLTLVDSNIEGDTFFPTYENFEKIDSKKGRGKELIYEWATFVKST